MLKYTLRRLILLVPVLAGVALLVFTLLYITPGDPARMALGEDAPQEAVEQFRKNYGLDDPFFVQFGRYCYKALLHGDIGNSYVTKSSVSEEIMTRFPTTLKLAFWAVVLGVALGLPFGIICAIRQYSIFDSVSMVLALIGVAMPNFWLGVLLILLFSVKLNWLPPSGFTTFAEMAMPVFTLSGGTLAVITRMTRSSMLEVIKSDYVRTARAKGQRESVIIWRHALPNALIPILTIVGMQFGGLLSGAILTETVFSIPGVGRLMVESIKMRDFPVVQGGVLYIALVFCFINLAVDLLYAWVDPRIKAKYR
ncbi:MULTISPECIES: ABC transporter permease [unclassified Pyramidobacter]|uniref:ABC transporter permease n=1 Tax=unclassified Pyramidobacter TaxID=2632171 RepID=UPI00098EE5C7|nr:MULTISPECIES: ABC transporter permease [unclassified Pyramidobacter]MCI7403221.1 ABC transporter permease [Pyramidobacter sp.]MDY3212062.1 ABC transporter permease [Pyramidobacter sp.]OON89593.1 peptide ABC transporter permease [Pyramidobacter sp. C12-8]RKJ78890.1 ABC transporter permease [Pyramidobacter sp. CG50-2]WOL40391.1 ABC transporter permease [Pyramidobacter sp. YE332]